MLVLEGTALYQGQYANALHLFKTGDMASCISAAKTSLRDINLSHYYKIKNCMIIAAAYDDWGNTEVWRLAAEQAYTTAFLDANPKDDPISLRILEYFRKELNECAGPKSRTWLQQELSLVFKH